MKVRLSSALEVFGSALYVGGNALCLANVIFDEGEGLWIDCATSTLMVKEHHCVFASISPGDKLVTIRQDPRHYFNPAPPIPFGNVSTLKLTILALREAAANREKCNEESRRCIEAVQKCGIPILVDAPDGIAFKQAKDDDELSVVRFDFNDTDHGAYSSRNGLEKVSTIREELKGLSRSEMEKSFSLCRWYFKSQGAARQAYSRVSMVEECLGAHISHSVSRMANEEGRMPIFFGKQTFIVDLPFKERAMVEIEGHMYMMRNGFRPHHFNMTDNSISGILSTHFDLSSECMGAFGEKDVDEMPRIKSTPKLLVLGKG